MTTAATLHAPVAKPKAKAKSQTQTDLEALRGSGRTKIALLSGVLLLAAGAAALSFMGGGGTGNPEDPAKVLVISPDGSHKAYLQDLGFEVDQQTFEHLELKARDEVPDLEATGLPAILELADRFGYGYVVVEGPDDALFSELEVEGELPSMSGARYAVVSVGDLADPAKVTVGSGMLSTMFEQDRLAEIVPAGEMPTVEAVQLRDQLRNAVERLTEPPPPRRFIGLGRY
ncbi:MAG: hypothetical protein AB1Z98_25255 [Nannocystaceae bacterium]